MKGLMLLLGLADDLIATAATLLLRDPLWPEARGQVVDGLLWAALWGGPAPADLCAGATNARYATTTEVYPDSPSADDDSCNRAQVAAIMGALDFIAREEKLK